MSAKFKIEGIGTLAKELTVRAPEGCEIQIKIDYDDVERDVVAREARKLCRILNEHWNERPRSTVPVAKCMQERE
jgi:hypothetical protein